MTAHPTHSWQYYPSALSPSDDSLPAGHVRHGKEFPLSFKQTCFMPCDVLSLNVDSGKTWCVTELLSTASDCPCYNVLYDGFFFDGWIWTIRKWPKPFWILNPGFRDPGRIFGIFSKFWWGKGQNWVAGQREISTPSTTTKIIDAASKIWISKKSGWDPGTCPHLTEAITWRHLYFGVAPLVYTGQYREQASIVETLH